MLSRVRLTQTLTIGVRAQRTFSTSAKWNQKKDQRERALEQDTLNVLLESAIKDKGRPLQEPAQRYHKFHKVGDLYHPRDLNDAEYQEMLRRRRNKPDPPKEDPFDKFDINPLHQYKDTKLLSCFVSDMGKILPRTVTGVSAKNQRKLAQAIKRARAMGLMSSTSQRNCSK